MSGALRAPCVVEHGGPDGGGEVKWDFSTNANPLPLPAGILMALAQADRTRYPDPHYTALRRQLSAVWSHDPVRILPASGSSEAIRRLSLAARLQGLEEVWLPWPAYGDYAAAARALGLAVRHHADANRLLAELRVRAGTRQRPVLVWLNEPCNPTGGTLPTSFWQGLHAVMANGAGVVAIDRAYEPLRLQGKDPIPSAVADLCWQLWSPNKALGLTGVRAGVVQAPDTDGWCNEALAHLHQGLQQAFESLAPSWVLSAEGVSLLQAWWQPDTQAWLAQCRDALKCLQQAQRHMLSALGWVHRPTVVPFGLSRPKAMAPSAMPAAMAHLRAQGLKLRDTTSMGLPGWWRLGTLPTEAQADLRQAWLSQPGQLPVVYAVAGCAVASQGPGWSSGIHSDKVQA